MEGGEEGRERKKKEKRERRKREKEERERKKKENPFLGHVCPRMIQTEFVNNNKYC